MRSIPQLSRLMICRRLEKMLFWVKVLVLDLLRWQGSPFTLDRQIEKALRPLLYEDLMNIKCEFQISLYTFGYRSKRRIDDLACAVPGSHACQTLQYSGCPSVRR